jgi:hypothetical protein
MNTNTQTTHDGSMANESIAPISTLPDEILLTIAGKLARNSSLRQLSLVSKRWQSIAQETLVKATVLPPYGICGFTRMLYIHRPDLALKIKSVDLGDYQYGMTKPYEINPGPGDLLNQFPLKCRALVDLINGEGHWRKMLGYTEENKDDSCWTSDRSLHLDVLIALSPNLRDLTIQLPPKKPHELPDEYELYCPFPKAASELLRTKLRGLTIPRTNTWQRLKTYNVNLRGFSSLARLSVPMDTFIYPNGEPTVPVEVLPPNLERLQLRPCNRYISSWLSKLSQACANTEFPSLCQLDLFFSSCIRTSLLLVDQGCGALEAFRSDSSLLTQKGITIRFFDGFDKPRNTLLEEVEAWSHLSDLEAWFTAGEGKQFSEMVARTESGAPRSRTKLEIRALLRNNTPLVKPRKVLRFAPEVSLDGIPRVTFGKKKEDKQLEAKCVPTAEVWTGMRSPCVIENLKTSFGVLQTIPEAPSSHQGAKRLSCVSPACMQSFRPFQILAAATIFDAEEWFGVTFFTSFGAKPARQSRSRKRSCKTTKKGAPIVQSPTTSPRRLKHKAV